MGKVFCHFDCHFRRLLCCFTDGVSQWFSFNFFSQMLHNNIVIFHYLHTKLLAFLLSWVVLTCFGSFGFSRNHCFVLMTQTCVSSNGSQDTIEENQEKKAVPVRRKRLTRSRFADSFSSHGKILCYYLFLRVWCNSVDLFSYCYYLKASVSDKKSFTVEAEEEEEKETKDGTEESSPRGVLEDFSVSIESETSSKASSSNSYESEATSPRASTSGSEGQPNATTPWRDFFRVFKKGPAASCHPLPPLKKGTPKLSKRKSRSRRFREEIVPTLTSPLDGEFCHFKSSWKNFSLSELHAATDTFSQGLCFFQNLYLCFVSLFTFFELRFKNFITEFRGKVCNSKYNVLFAML